MSVLGRSLLLFALALGGLFYLPARAQAPDEAAMAVHLLDYLGADYSGAVKGGKVISADEYKEMREFSTQIGLRMHALAENPSREGLEREARQLAALVSEKADPAKVGEATQNLRRTLIAAYGIRVSPRSLPVLAEAPVLYNAHCASCHGVEGRGDGPAAKGLDPAPANFHDAARMAGRSTYALYNSISLGVQGTSMVAFSQLPEKDRWALAFFVANVGVPAQNVSRGEALWKLGKTKTSFATLIPDLAALVSLSPNELLQRGGDDAVLVQDYLRSHPGMLEAGRPAPLALARTRLGEMLTAYKNGNYPEAQQLAISAYLDGFELAETSLDSVDHELRMEIEREMLALRGLVNEAASLQEVERQARQVDTLLDAAKDKLASGDLTPAGAFASSLIILTREGLEAILILAAIIAFVARTGRRDAMRWVHAGWVAALALGVLTWVAANFLIDVSGANRELTSGITALVAAGMLLYVGWWLHGRTQAQSWNRFLRDQVNAALEQKTLLAVASVSFLAVYRELFEVVLFYQALWIQAGSGGRHAVLGGICAACALLAIVGWGIFKYSLRLPLKPFFSAMAVLMVLLAVVFAGQGIAALQEAGALGVRHVPFVSLPMLGVHPTAQTLGAQLAVLIAVALGWLASRERASGSKA